MGDLPNSPRRLNSGAAILAVTAFLMGMMGLVRGDFTIAFHPVPDDLPVRPILLVLVSSGFIASSGLLLFPRERFAGGLALAAIFALLSLGWLQRIILFPTLIGTWLGFSEQIALAAGALAVASSSTKAPRRFRRSVRVIFGLCQLVFALGHFLAMEKTVAMTPTYIPPGPGFWAIATGVLHLLGGMMLIAGFRTFAATRTLAVMFASFGAFVWLPMVLGDPLSPLAWAGSLVNLALVGAVLSVGDAYRIKKSAKIEGCPKIEEDPNAA